MAAEGIEFWKGHGTGNDFVVIPDPDGSLRLTAADVARICDRRRGLGADGLIRVVRTARFGSDGISDGSAAGIASPGAEWFMDYRNADGSVAEMCGNGARVFVRVLVESGLMHGTSSTIMTRGGERRVRLVSDGCVAVEMGQPAEGPEGPEVPAGQDPVVSVPGQKWPASAWWMPNPHAVAWVSDLSLAGELTEAPLVRSDRFADGVNVEFAVDRSRSAAALVADMRVFERGVGETLSCGTGACAVALALRERHGVVDPGGVLVNVPGGSLEVSVDEWDRVWLSGPVELVAHGRLLPGWLGIRR